MSNFKHMAFCLRRAGTVDFCIIDHCVGANRHFNGRTMNVNKLKYNFHQMLIAILNTNLF